ncbi:MAG: 50S ribosomal protein L11 methyltransferase [Planctomycetaceae bacterium]
MSFVTASRIHASVVVGVLLASAGCDFREATEPRSSPQQPAANAVAAASESVLPAAALNDGPPPVVRWETVDELPRELAIFRHVFWEPDDTRSLRQLIRATDMVKGKRVLEIGTGSGLISLCCLQAGAAHVLATDINPFAMKNSAFNAELLGFTERFEVRLVPQRSPDAWSVIREQERFDLIISNPPWENDKPVTLAEFALYDPEFQLMKSLLDGLPDRLNPGGRALLAYGCVTAIRRLQELAAERNLALRILDDRLLDQLDEVFLPGMLLEITLPETTRHESPTAGDGGSSAER